MLGCKYLKKYGNRFLAMRLSIHYTKYAMARVLGTTTHTYSRIESGRVQPSLVLLRKLRILERAFSYYLKEYYKQVKKFGSKWTWGRESKVYRPFGGYAYDMRPVSYRCSSLIPGKDEDISELGGMEVFGFIENPVRGIVE